MLKKISLLAAAVVMVASIAIIPASAAVTLSISNLDRSITEKSGQVYELEWIGTDPDEEKDKAHEFTLNIDATTTYNDYSLRVKVPSGVDLRWYDADGADGAGWYPVSNNQVIGGSKYISVDKNTEQNIRFHIRLDRAGEYDITFDMYKGTSSSSITKSLTTTWTAPLSKYSISFANIPTTITPGQNFDFKTYVRNTESKEFDYDTDTVLRVTVSPNGNYTIAEREGEGTLINMGENTGNIEFELPDENSVISRDFTAMFQTAGEYKLVFSVVETGTNNNRVIATNTLTLQVGQSTSGGDNSSSGGSSGGGTVTNPGTGSNGNSTAYAVLPILTLALFAFVYKTNKNESVDNA